VADDKIGRVIKEKLGIQCVKNDTTDELMRGIRGQLANLVSGVGAKDMGAMALGLSHSLSRYKLKFSPDKVDTMIVQAINLLDDLDKEINTYAMRVREWYGWHFPEMGKIVADNQQYAKVALKAGVRSAMQAMDFSGILAEDVEASLKATAQVSMGTEISDEDRENIQELCRQVISLGEYRGQLYDYLQNRMTAIAPNLTIMVGELVGARLIAHAGSLMNLAKQPASTVQILGAEKALFRALKTKHDTPKYGLIYHASLIGQAAPKHKGKISRVLAAKTALSVRVDALGDNDTATIGLECREKVEARLRQLEGKQRVQDSGGMAGRAQPMKLSPAGGRMGASAMRSVTGLDPDADDAVMGGTGNGAGAGAGAGAADDKAARKAAKKAAKAAKKEAKKKRKREEAEAVAAAAAGAAAAAAEDNGEPQKKKKKKDKKKKKKKSKKE